MKHIISTFFLCVLLGNVANAQLRAVTSNGDEVILNSDGTWKYSSEVNGSADENTIIDTNKIVFNKSTTANSPVKSSRVPYTVFIDPKKWSFEKSEGDGPSEFDFTLKNKDAYGMLISEKIEIPMKTLKMAALGNARRVSQDVHVVKEEYRKVNGKLLLYMQMDGTINEVKFSYLGYYYSTANGTIQLLTYTASNLKDEYAKDLEEFLNGFMEKE